MWDASRRENRRNYKRVTIRGATARLLQASGEELIKGGSPCEDIAPDGLFVSTRQPIGEQQRLTVHLRLPSMTTPLVCEAVVVRVEHDYAGAQRGLGLRFLDVTGEQLAYLMEHLYRSYHAQEQERERQQSND